MKKSTTDLDTEDLDLSSFGLYHQKEPGVPEDDYFLSGYTTMGKQLWVRKSEHGQKWHLYKDGSVAFGLPTTNKVTKKRKKK